MNDQALEKRHAVDEETVTNGDADVGSAHLVCCAADSCHTVPMVLRYRLQSNRFVGKLARKYLLPLGTRQVGDDVVFFNFGYEEDPPMALPLVASDEPNRFGIQLYHRTATQVDLNGKRVLEVSCGAGGGASYIVRTLRPACYRGLDLNPASIDFCRKTHNLPGLDFVQGDAEDLPFADQSFDVVINVEASHQYPHLPRFLTEVARVLRPGGHFLYADSRRRRAVAAWEAALADAPMRLLSQRSIEEEALRGLRENTRRSQELISRRVPVFLLGVIRSSIGVLDWELCRAGGFAYRMYCFAKA
jgi:ubiquinone/menaquinone biosynthesis C-methylase UbiE